MLTDKKFLILLAICTFNLALAVALGAFAAHGLKSILSVYKLGVFQKACEYLTFQSLGVVVLLLLKFNANLQLKIYIPIMLLIGTYIFSISVGFTAFSELDGLALLSKAGIIAPIGGVLMILAWLLASLNLFKLAKNK
ncbi:MAG: DUF423 domain-containing protein [Bacteroidia bacterium]|nr:DUF423 domain-containing protein [Bacteroidia bacterium]